MRINDLHLSLHREHDQRDNELPHSHHRLGSTLRQKVNIINFQYQKDIVVPAIETKTTKINVDFIVISKHTK